MNVRDIMMRDVILVEPRTPLVQAAQQMVEHDIGFLPVVENGALVGVVTDRDIVARGVAESRHLPQATVGDVMSVEIVCCFGDEDVEEAQRRMAEHQVTRLPVIDEGRGLVGVISTSNFEGGAGGIGAGKKAARKKSVGVTFSKEKTDSHGRPHKVAVKTIYITGKPSKEEAVEAAVHRFETEQGASSWRNAANSIDVEEAPATQPKKP